MILLPISFINKSNGSDVASELQGDSLERGPEYSVVTPIRMKQSEPKKIHYIL